MSAKHLALVCWITLASLLVLPGAFGEVIYDEWILAGSNITVDGTNFASTYSFTSASLMIEHDKNKHLLKNNSCEFIDMYRFCFNGTRFSFDNNWGKWDMELSLAIPETHLIVQKYNLEIMAERDFEKTSAFVDDIVQVWVTLTNKGDKKAGSVVYTEIIPQNAQVVNTEGASINYHNIEWKGTLTDNPQRFAYWIAIKNESDVELKSKVSYVETGEKRFAELDKDILDVNPAVTVKGVLSKPRINLEKKSVYQLDIENDADQDVEVDTAYVYLSGKSMLLAESDDMKHEKEGFMWNGVVDAHTTKHLEVTLSSPVSMNVSVEGFIRYIYQNRTYEKRDNRTLEVINPGVMVGVSMFPGTLISDGFGYAKVHAKNNDPDHAIYNLSYVIESDYLTGTSGSFAKVQGGKDVLLYGRSFKVPWVDKSERHVISVNVTYVGQDGELTHFNMSNYMVFEPHNFEPVITLNVTCPTIVSAEQGFWCNLSGRTVKKVQVYDIMTEFNSSVSVKTSKITGPKLMQIAAGDNSTHDFGAYRIWVKNISNQTLVIQFTADYHVLKLGEIDERQRVSTTALIQIKNLGSAKIADMNITNSTLIDSTVTVPKNNLSNRTGAGKDNITSAQNISRFNAEDPKTDQWHNEKKKGFFSRIIEWITGLFS